MKARIDRPVLVLLAPGFEEADVVTITRTLRHAGVAVVLVGLAAGPIRGSYGLALAPDRTLTELEPDPPAAIVLPGGRRSTTHLAGDPRVHELLHRVAQADAYILAVSPACSVLQAAGIPTPFIPAHLPAEQVFVNGPLVLAPAALSPETSAHALLGLLGYTITRDA